tara:strand:- start:190 stop:882 length:693 start_codon:yes stop_codon:yes gene_type:complete
MKIVVISCGPGLDEVKNKYGHSYQWVQDRCDMEDIYFSQSNVYKGEFPKLEDGDGWIITGSAKSVYEDLDWIVELEMLIKRAHEIQKPILGICFGHQIIAQALGGIVKKNKKGWELGSCKININNHGALSKIFKDILLDDYFYMSHQDTVSKLPNHSLELASNEMGNQAYSIGGFIYGVQFHPEFSQIIAEKYALIRYEKGVLKNKPIVFNSQTSYNVINNFIKILQESI